MGQNTTSHISNHTQDPEEYREKWRTHVKTIKRMGWNLENQEDREELQEKIQELNQLIDKASNNIGEK